MISKPADEPDIHVCVNDGRPGLVLIAIGSGTDGWNITPDQADTLAEHLVKAAAAARTGDRTCFQKMTFLPSPAATRSG